LDPNRTNAGKVQAGLIVPVQQGGQGLAQKEVAYQLPIPEKSLKSDGKG